MAWFYIVRDGNDNEVSRGEGFSTQAAAHKAGSDEALRLATTGNMPGGGVGTVTIGQDATEPWQ